MKCSSKINKIGAVKRIYRPIYYFKVSESDKTINNQLDSDLEAALKSSIHDFSLSFYKVKTC